MIVGASVPLRVRAPLIMLLGLTSPNPGATLALTASSVVLSSGGDFFFERFGGMVDLAGDRRNARQVRVRYVQFEVVQIEPSRGG